MDRDNRGNGYGNGRSNHQRGDENQYRGAYRQDTDRGNEYDEINRRNFNDRDISADYRSRDYRGSNEDRRRERDREIGPDYGQDRNRRGENLSNFGAHEDNNGLEGASRNYGNMGSYGGAQGWGSSANGSHGGTSGQNKWASGHGREENRNQNRQIYGAYRDHNSFADGEREQYDGTSRYGTQGADNTRGWEPSDRAGSRGGVRDIGTQHTSRRGDDSQYEIYDNAQSQYNRGNYGNQMGGGSNMNSGYDRRSHAENSSQLDYNQRPRTRQDQEGQGARSENYGNMAGSLSWGIDSDYRSEEGRDRRYDPMSGHIRSQGSQPASREDFSW